MKSGIKPLDVGVKLFFVSVQVLGVERNGKCKDVKCFLCYAQTRQSGRTQD